MNLTRATELHEARTLIELQREKERKRKRDRERDTQVIKKKRELL